MYRPNNDFNYRIKFHLEVFVLNQLKNYDIGPHLYGFGVLNDKTPFLVETFYSLPVNKLFGNSDFLPLKLKSDVPIWKSIFFTLQDHFAHGQER